jgi:hypothetical protein
MLSSPDLVCDPYGDVMLGLLRQTTPESTRSNLNQDGSDASEAGQSPASEEICESPSEDFVDMEEVTVRASSRHLALASKVFRVMFDGDFSEGVASAKDGPLTLTLPDDDAEAMTVLLSIVHGLNKRVPRKIERELFVKIAILIDKYELHEVAEVWTELWFDDLRMRMKETTPSSSSQVPSRHPGGKSQPSPSELNDWIYLCWVFRHEFEFHGLTRKAMMDSGRYYEDRGLPVPEMVGGKVASNPSVYAH